MRLISFLGTGNYSETTYSFDCKTCCTRYVAQALASFTQPMEIRVIATSEAWNQHGASLAQALLESGQPHLERVSVPTAGDADSLWQMFGAIVEAIRTSPFPVLLDITHGFRMQPFFAAACIQYVQAIVPNPPNIRVVYGEFRGHESESPIWELTPFLDVLTWSRNLMMFLQTGQADTVVEPTERLGRDLNKQWATTGREGPQPQLQKFSKALQQFSDDFTTIRTGSLLIGTKGSASKLAEAIQQTKEELSTHLPALALILDQVAEIVSALQSDARLSEPEGQRALLALARLYQKMGRYSEAISILREGWITLGANPNADHPGTAEFDNSARETLDKNWSRRVGDNPDPVSELRNDIQHAGFKKHPHDKTWFKNQLNVLMNKWASEIDRTELNTGIRE